MQVLVIGGTRGIGRSFVRAMANDGYNISVLGLHKPDAAGPYSANIRYWQCDLADKKRLLKIMSDIISSNGRLDSIIFFQRYREGGDDWQGEIETSLTATKDIIDFMADKFNDKGGSIAIVNSLASHYIADEQPLSYHVAKAALKQLARFYAFKLGKKRIRVNSVLLGSVLKDETRAFYKKNRKLYNLYCRITPLGRMATPSDITGLIAFLCSDKSSFITGQEIVVDGGASIQSHEALSRKLASLKNIKLTRSGGRY